MTVIRVGEADIRRAEEMRIQVLTEAFIDKSMRRDHASFLASHMPDSVNGLITMIMQTWIIRVDGRVIVVDPCNGNGRARAGATAMFNNLNTDFLERFRATGTDPADVSYVFCTHLHCDHCGWNTQARDGHWVPTFPKARYLFVRKEYDRWDPNRIGHVAVDFNVGVFEDSVRPIVEAGLADLVPEWHQFSPSLQIEPAPGHTLGHAVLHLTSANKEAYFVGDVLHHPVEIARPEIDVAADDKEMSIATRKRLLERLADSGALCLPAHFAEPHGGYVRRAADGYRFEALA
jgi:glyoxylase-like metal-dependent hydrolase (beta-lactamase superfamily II)